MNEMSGMEALVQGRNAVENEYIDFGKLSALVIDDISSMRHAVRSQLQSLGINSVKLASTATEALVQVEANAFDIIICDYNLNNASSGQHFLEHLRSENLLSATSIFVMLTAETEYDFVASAVEFIPDDYLLKPCPEKKLRSRLMRLLDKRAFLMPVLKAINARQYDVAVRECNRLLGVAPDERRMLDVLRRKADSELAMQDYAMALETFDRAASLRSDVPWIMMGQARAHYALGELEAAARIAKQLVEMNRNYVSAYELLSRIAIDMDDEAGAYEYLCRSSAILPSAKRFRAVSQAAFLMGKLDEAKSNSLEAIKLSTGSMVERTGDYLSLAQVQVDMGDQKGAIETLEKTARKHGEVGLFGVAKNAILAQAYFDLGDHEKSQKLLERSKSLLANRKNSFVMTALGKSALKAGDVVLGLKMMTEAIQVSGKDEKRIARHVKKSMKDTGHDERVEDVIDGGRKRILNLVEEANRLMRTAHFDEAYLKVKEAFAIHGENLDALMTAAQLHLLWLKQGGMNEAIVERAKDYLMRLDRLLPNNQKVMNFYRFFNEIVSE